MKRRSLQAPAGRGFMLDVLAIEFTTGQKTLWVHGKAGTVLRIKCTGQIKVTKCTTSPVPHADLMVDGDIEFCVPKTARGKKKL